MIKITDITSNYQLQKSTDSLTSLTWHTTALDKFKKYFFYLVCESKRSGELMIKIRM